MNICGVAFFLLVFIIVAYMFLEEFKSSKDRLDLSKVHKKYSQDSFNTFEDLVNSDRYTYYKLAVLSNDFRIGNVFFEKEGVCKEEYHGSHVSPTTGEVSYCYSYDNHILIKSYVKHKSCVYDNGEVTVKLLKGQRLIILWSDNDDLLSYILDNFENIVEEK